MSYPNVQNMAAKYKIIGSIDILFIKDLHNSIDTEQNDSDRLEVEIEEVDNLKKLKDLISERGDTNVKIVVQYNSKNLIFELSEKRKINPEILKSLKNEPYLKRINL